MRLPRVPDCKTGRRKVTCPDVDHLQRIQNSAARIVTNTRKYGHITPILQKLQWLPVRQRIHFKTLLITFKSISDIKCQNTGVNWCPLESHPEKSDTIAGASISAQVIWWLCI